MSKEGKNMSGITAIMYLFQNLGQASVFSSVSNNTSLESKIKTSHAIWSQKHGRPGMKIDTMLDTLRQTLIILLQYRNP